MSVYVKTRRKFSKNCVICILISVCHRDKLTGWSAILKKMANPILNDKLRPGAPRAASSEARLGIITNIITNDGRLNSEQIAVIIGISSCTVL